MALREILAKFGFDIDDSKLKAAHGHTDSLAHSLHNLGKLFAAHFIFHGLHEMLSEMSEMNLQLENSSLALGINYQDLQRWNTAAKFAGISAEQVANGMKFLEKNAVGAPGAFAAIGVAVRDAEGKVKPVNELMKETGEAIAGMGDPAERTAATLKIFGRQGLALAPLFAKGAEGLEEMLGALDELGGGITEEGRAALNKLHHAEVETEISFLSFKVTLLNVVLPAITGIMHGVQKSVLWFKKMSEETHLLKATLIAVTGAMIIFKGEAIAAGAKAVLAWAPLIIGLAFAILLVDDLITTFEGGDSVISRVIHNLFGKAGDSVIKSAIEDWKHLREEMSKTGVNPVEEVLSEVGASLTKFVVEDIPEFASRLLFGTTNGFTQVGNMIWSQSGAWVQKIQAQIANIPTVLKQLGIDMMQSIADGIRSAIDKVEGSITDLEGKIKDKLKSVFSWHSPIPLFVDLGQDMAKGVPKGLGLGQRGVEDAIGNFAGGITGAAQGAARGPGATHIRSEVHNVIHAGAGNAGLRDAVRDGATAGLGDLNAELAALEFTA